MIYKLKIDNRPYETKAVHDLIIELPAHKRVLAVAPTGAGKTVIALMMLLAEPRWRRVLWLAHRVELISQAREHLQAFGVPTGVRCAKYTRAHPGYVDLDARIQIGSVQTVIRQDVFDVDLIVIDEAHRALADTYQEITRLRPSAEILGLTATPCRLDGRGLGDFFKRMLVMAVPSELYTDGYLANPVTYAADPATRALLTKELGHVGTTHGEFKTAELGRAVGKHILVGNVVTEAVRLAPKVPKVVFAATVEHSKKITTRFKRHGVTARHLDSETSSSERERMIVDLASGKLEVICNVDVLTEGWDCPALGAVVIARPTKSLVRFMQMIGRVQRPGGTPRKLVIDHGGNAERLQHFPGEDVAWQLTPDRPQREHDQRVRTCIACQALLEGPCELCLHCGAKQPISERRRIEEREARLVKLERERIEQLRTDVRRHAASVAKRVDAPAEWIERVVDELVSRAPRPHSRIKP